MKSDETDRYYYKIGHMLAKARYDAQISQEECGIRIGKSLRTVQNWESGYSSPTLAELILCFDNLGLNLNPYLRDLLYGDITARRNDTVNEKRTYLKKMVDALTERELDDLIFLLSGDNGSSVYAMLQLFVADAQCPMINRQTVATLVENNYNIATEMGTLVCSDKVTVDLDTLHRAILKGTESAIKKGHSYML